MKKLLAVLLSVLMLVSCCALGVAADDMVYNDGTLDWDKAGDIFNDTELDWSGMACQFVVGNAAAKAGETIVVPVSIANNPGIVSLKLAVAYDPAVLELIEATAGDFIVAEQENVTVASPSFGPLENPFIINWIDALAGENNTQTGVVANLTFKIKEGATGTTEISVSAKANDVFDKDYENVPFLCTAGVVTVKPPHTPGDVDDNGTVNVRDLGRLQQYLNGFDVVINMDAANVDGNTSVNVRDLGRLQQYLNGFDVELL